MLATPARAFTRLHCILALCPPVYSYFGGCPVLNIPGRTHPVKEYYLEDVLQMTR